MKKLLLVAIIFFVSLNLVQAQKINWVSMEEAIALQKKDPKKIMMDVYTNWCGPCKMLDKNTFQNKDVAAYINKNYYAVKFNAEGNDVVKYMGKTYSNPNYNPDLANRRNAVHELTLQLKVNAYPTIVFFDETANMISPLRGYQKPQQLELYLKMFKNNDHKDMKTQDDFNAYYEAFTPSFQ